MEKQMTPQALSGKPLARKDLLFHSVHGLCQVVEILRPAGAQEPVYNLVPVSTNNAKVRFVVPHSSLEVSGFEKLLTINEANAIMEYFKTGNKKNSECGRAWSLSVLIRSESHNKESLKDGRRRQKLLQSVKGLAAELAYVLKSTVRQIAEQIRKNLGPISSINYLVLLALQNADKD